MSFVAMGKKQCLICGEIHDHGAEILLHKQMKDIEDQVTGNALCEEHDKLFKAGYICLVGAVPPDDVTQMMSPYDTERTGEIIHIKLEMFNRIMDNPAPADLPFVFVEDEIIKNLKDMMAEHAAHTQTQH